MDGYVEALPTEWQPQWDHIQQKYKLVGEPVISMLLLNVYLFSYPNQITQLKIQNSPPHLHLPLTMFLISLHFFREERILSLKIGRKI